VAWRPSRIQYGRVMWRPIDAPSPLAPPADPLWKQAVILLLGVRCEMTTNRRKF
ncbi:hypothetical protein NPIL_597031, partial [Nephila pilipes]